MPRRVRRHQVHHPPHLGVGADRQLLAGRRDGDAVRHRLQPQRRRDGDPRRQLPPLRVARRQRHQHPPVPGPVVAVQPAHDGVRRQRRDHRRPVHRRRRPTPVAGHHDLRARATARPRPPAAPRACASSTTTTSTGGSPPTVAGGRQAATVSGLITHTGHSAASTSPAPRTRSGRPRRPVVAGTAPRRSTRTWSGRDASTVAGPRQHRGRAPGRRPRRCTPPPTPAGPRSPAASAAAVVPRQPPVRPDHRLQHRRPPRQVQLAVDRVRPHPCDRAGRRPARRARPRAAR